ncbi:cell cycle protein kinase [Purpureocillium lavendulum]|uniref:Cell cycle protein kinase n=1 Tax=Purpureocillium lavendulum TaxID=1247861 RepID=A0AB34FXW9_9HYPO|nr:cell cycle protein kinase [Purpureocillium lavendulum]
MTTLAVQKLTFMAPSRNTLLCLLALAAAASSSPLLDPRASTAGDQPAPTKVAKAAAKVNINLGAQIGGDTTGDATTPVSSEAAAAAMVTPMDFAVDWAGQVTVTVQNRWDGDIKTRHVVGFGSPAPWGNPGTGIIPRGGQSVFTAGPGWHGNIVVNGAAYPVDTGDESQIEGSFANQGQGNRGDINVSFVNGFSVPIVCKCNENNIYTGCSKNLWEYGKCPNDNWKHSCRNDARKYGWNTPPAPFFQPCRGPSGAYTFPADDLANSLNARCPSEQYTCCVGKGCPPNPAQGSFH